MKYLIIILLLAFSFNTQAQNKKKENNRSGINTVFNSDTVLFQNKMDSIKILILSVNDQTSRIDSIVHLQSKSILKFQNDKYIIKDTFAFVLSFCAILISWFGIYHTSKTNRNLLVSQFREKWIQNFRDISTELIYCLDKLKLMYSDFNEYNIEIDDNKINTELELTNKTLIKMKLMLNPDKDENQKIIQGITDFLKKFEITPHIQRKENIDVLMNYINKQYSIIENIIIDKIGKEWDKTKEL